MAVRITQPPIDLRSKLSELERPIGLKGGELLRAETTQDARDLVSAGRKNILHNGDMKIHQRSETITATGSGSAIYSLDRWKTWCYPSAVSAVFTIQQATSNPPPGFHNYLRWTTRTAYAVSGNSNSFFDIQQVVEGNNLKGIDIGKSTAKPLTISFWVRSSIAGKYTFAIHYNGSNPSNYLKYYNINSANTWEYKTITLPPHTATANGESAGSSGALLLSWNMGMGTTYGSTSTTEGYIHNKYELGGSVRIIENTSATFDLTGVQLEVGKVATEFDHRSYGEELALCQRYYQEIGKGSSTNDFIASGFVDSSGANFYGGGFLKVPMRTTPVVSFTGTIGHFDYTQPSFSTAANSIASYWANPNSYVIRLTSLSTGGTTGYGAYARITTSSTALTFNAEL